MKRILFPLAVLLAMLLPASAQETAPPPAAESPPAAPAAPTAPPATPPKEAATPADDSDSPPDLGENVSADNNVSFPVDI